MKIVPSFLLFLLILCTGIAKAGEENRITLSPSDTHSNQNQINEAIKTVAASGGTVYLNPGVYYVDNTIVIRSNVHLLGDPEAIIRVSPRSSQWFKGRIGVISCKESLKNVEIAGFQIDGNIGNLPRSYANSQPGREHDCEKLINIGGYSGDFANNIKIHDMKLYNAFSDGIYIIYAQNVEIYNNFISNCQHEGIYLSVVRGGGYIHHNKIAGITSDAARLDNCKQCLIEYNLFFSYGGESYGAYKHGENGLQIGDAGSSKGYNAVKKGYHTEDIEVRFNTFADPGLRAIWLHSGTKNVYIHDNKFVDAEVLETMGVPLGDISYENDPAIDIETSEKAFRSIFDILKMDYSFKYPNVQLDLNSKVQVIAYQNYSLVNVQGEGLTAVKVHYEDKQVTHYIEKDIWVGDLHHQGNKIYLPGSFQKGALKVTCISRQGYQDVTDFEIIEKQEETGSINPDIVPYTGTLLITGIAIFRNFRRMIK